MKRLRLLRPAHGPRIAGAEHGAGTWTVAQGSQAGYRVEEQFAGQQATHEAVARTTSVSGGVTVQRAASGLQLSGLRVTAQLADLQSQDQVAGFNVSQRDRIVSGSLAVAQYPRPPRSRRRAPSCRPR